MRVVFLLTVLITLTACSSTPQVIPLGGNTYTISGESEFSYSDMVNGMYVDARKKCLSQGRDFKIVNTRQGYGSIGIAGTKRGFTLNFRCL